ncbi:YigZ family protein, partial [Francisella tularensis subsp. holarctica]|nr:YigZ family protein [Francisella tularensis subsp. holarctica]
GLIRAYGQAAKEGLTLVKITWVEVQNEISLEYDYSETANVENLANRSGIQIIKENYSDNISKIIKIVASDK